MAHSVASRLCIFCLVVAFLSLSLAAKNKNKEQIEKNEDEKWKKKDIRDYNDADLERLFDQWEEADEDELENDELPEWKREPPKVDITQLDAGDPEGFLKLSKKGQTLMMFATISGDPTEAETDKISALWHSSLYNAHINCQRFVVGANRVLFMLDDGSKAWEIKDFLVKQDRCEEVSIEGQTYPGKAGKKKDKPDKKKEEL